MFGIKRPDLNYVQTYKILHDIAIGRHMFWKQAVAVTL